MFACLLDAAEANHGLTARHCVGQTPLNAFFDCKVDVGRELGIEVGIALTTKQEGTKAADRTQKAAHAGSSPLFIASTRSMTPVRRSQSWASVASRRRPDLVME